MDCKYWACVKVDDDGTCEETGFECIGYLCEDFHTCRSCNKQDGEDCPEY